MTTEVMKEKLVEFAKKKFKQYKLVGWNIYFTNHSGVLGMCYNKQKKIRMSIPWMKTVGYRESCDTLLHEIAHALTKHGGHTAEFYANCKRVGCKVQRCYTGGKSLPSKYKRKVNNNYYSGSCPKCGREFATRIPTNQSCRRCYDINKPLEAHITWHKCEEYEYENIKDCW